MFWPDEDAIVADMALNYHSLIFFQKALLEFIYATSNDMEAAVN